LEQMNSVGSLRIPILIHAFIRELACKDTSNIISVPHHFLVRKTKSLCVARIITRSAAEMFTFLSFLSFFFFSIAGQERRIHLHA